MPNRLLRPFALAFAALAVAVPVAADCDLAGPVAEELESAPIAFVGTVLRTDGPVATFSVLEVWAGEIGPTEEVRGAMDLGPGQAAEDDRSWEHGATYLVLPYDHGGVLRDTTCTATTAWSPELAELRPASARVLEGAGGGGVPWQLVLAGLALGAVGVGSAVAFRRR